MILWWAEILSSILRGRDARSVLNHGGVQRESSAIRPDCGALVSIRHRMLGRSNAHRRGSRESSGTDAAKRIGPIALPGDRSFRCDWSPRGLGALGELAARTNCGIVVCAGGRCSAGLADCGRLKLPSPPMAALHVRCAGAVFDFFGRCPVTEPLQDFGSAWRFPGAIRRSPYPLP